MAGWISPTGHGDPGNEWNNEDRAYDEDIGTWAQNDNKGAAYSNWLELTHSAIYCHKVRYRVKYAADSSKIKIEIYDGSWHPVYEKTSGHLNHTWFETPSFGTYLVTKARVAVGTSTDHYKILVEFDFLEDQAPTAPTALLCEGATNPSDVADTTPEFSSVFDDPDGTGEYARYYQLQVIADGGDFGLPLWDSGKTELVEWSPGVAENARCGDISYAGAVFPLDGAKYYWRMKYWDDEDAEGSWSDGTANFTIVTIGPLGIACGEQNPTLGEVAVSWQMWSDGAAGSPEIVGDQDWGKIRLEGAEISHSSVVGTGNSENKTFKVTGDRYGTGSGEGTTYVRGQAAIFDQDDTLPSWQMYSAPFIQNWQYVQVKLVGPPGTSTSTSTTTSTSTSTTSTSNSTSTTV